MFLLFYLFDLHLIHKDCNMNFLDYSLNTANEIEAFFKKTGKIIRAITVKDILDEQIAYKLA